MKGTPYRFLYIDAVAGTGYVASPVVAIPDDCLLFPDIASNEGAAFLVGSARVALEVKPEFREYIFIEKAAGDCAQLEGLRAEYATVSERIRVVHAECNSYLLDLCGNYDWKRNRAVLFLDPFFHRPRVRRDRRQPAAHFPGADQAVAPAPRTGNEAAVFQESLDGSDGRGSGLRGPSP